MPELVSEGARKKTVEKAGDKEAAGEVAGPDGTGRLCQRVLSPKSHEQSLCT